MKRIFLLLALLFAASVQAQKITPVRPQKTTTVRTRQKAAKPPRVAREGMAFGPGINYVNLGVGLGAQYGGGLPFGISYDRGVTDKFSLGAQLDYYSWKYNSGYYNYRYNFLPIGIRGAYHFMELGDPENLDVYAGLALGYYTAHYTSDAPPYFAYSDNYRSRLFLNVFAGGRYFFAPNAGVFAELGYGVAWLKVGVTLRF